MSESREQLFDEWADSYDESLRRPAGFPFEGYERVLELVAERSGAESGMEVLDLGIGTGNLAALFLDLGCTVWGLDFSLKMLAKVHARFPQIELLKADIRGDWPIDVDRRFDRVVSAYVLHEFDLESKLRLLLKLLRDHVVEGGRVIVGDISFATRGARDEAQERLGGTWNAEKEVWEGSIWDDDEHYWAADETIETLARAGMTACYEQVSFCGGVYVLDKAAMGGGNKRDPGRPSRQPGGR
jgi:putative AdoMet-dependent methyltransferase